MNQQQEPKTFEEDGTRPIDDGNIEVADTFEEDGTRPIAKGPDFLVQNQKNQADLSNKQSTSDNDNEDNSQAEGRVFKEDGTRPIKDGDIEVADTFEEDGTRPIAKGPDFLVQNRKNQTDPTHQKSARDDNEDNSQAESRVLKVDGKRPIDNSDVDVADTFEEDGTRPIMKNKYDVVDTLDIDGERPITSE